MTAPRPIDIAEYYDYTSVQKLVQEYGIDALMALYDPTSIRIEQRKKANRTTINGVDLLPVEKTLDAIHKAMAAAK